MSIRVCQASLSAISNDPRVMRTISALEDDGYDVIPVGYGHGLTPTPMTGQQKIRTTLRKMPSNFLGPRWSSAAYWRKSENRKLYELLMQHHPKIIHAHDWNTLPAAARAAGELGAALVYDSHEFAVGQRQHRLFWRMVYPAYIKDLESQNIKSADHVITVSNGLAKLLQKNYALRKLPTVLRSTPDYKETLFRQPDPDHLLVHYHGIFTQGRGLQNLIKSVPLWPQHFALRLTGWGQPPRFEMHLKKLAEQLGVGERVTFAQPVPHSQLIDHASEADIGICFWSGETPQHDFALPNKVFEYTLAGLMLVNGPGSDLKDFTNQFGHGLSIDDNNPETLAELLKILSCTQISTCKQEALKAAKIFNWAMEKKKLLTIYADLTRSLK